ncbi:hypothetical protein VTO42DRAFT_5698 [Malbranchea cinnamomea]
MVKIETFEVEQWLASHSAAAKYDLATSCARPISIQELEELSEDTSDTVFPPTLLSKGLEYGTFAGSEKLRSTLAQLYSVKTPSPLPVENVLITPGSTLANYLVFYTLCSSDDHVIVQYPTYQQLYTVPSSLGADVTLWKAKEQDKWSLDVDELKGLIKSNTKMIVLTNPQNPTGAIIPRRTLEDIIQVAREHSIYVFSDEVYRPLFHSISPMDDDFPPSAMSLGYDKVIVTGSMSKSYSLPGIRVGWVASRRRDLVDACLNYRSYTTISVSQLDDEVAAYALNAKRIHRLLKHNVDLAKRNLEILDAFIERHRWACEWVRPVAGSVAFVKFSKMGKAVDDMEFCKQLLNKKGVLLSPGCSCFGNHEDFKGYVRIGYVMKTEDMEAGLSALAEFLDEDYEGIPLAPRTLPLR